MFPIRFSFELDVVAGIKKNAERVKSTPKARFVYRRAAGAPTCQMMSPSHFIQHSPSAFSAAIPRFPAFIFLLLKRELLLDESRHAA